MNEFLPDVYVENVKRLALGLEPLDALHNMRIVPPLTVMYDAAVRGLPRPAIDRHPSCLHVLIFGAAVATPVELRLFENNRRFVARRIQYPIHPQATAETRPTEERVRRPTMFPGANYDLDSGATGLRGRVLRGGAPMRWARVEANVSGVAEPLARAHGDDRGEFLLVLPADNNLSSLDPLWPLDVTVFGPAAPPAPATPDLPAQDPLWDLPLEAAPVPGTPDLVSPGVDRPAGYTASQTLPVDFVPGRVISQVTFTIV
jgi:hypothetical protein